MLDHPNEPRPQGAWLTRIGFFATLIYLGLVAFFSILHFSSFEELGPDGWANFMAGIFAPLAFCWLVLGFLQQGYELRHSAHALWLQSEELKNSVSQQKALVETAREQMEFEREALKAEREERDRKRRTILKGRPGGGSTAGHTHVTRSIQFENYGAECTNLRIELLREGEILAQNHTASLAKGRIAEIQFHSEVGIDLSELIVNCLYVDIENVQQSESFRIEGDAQNPGNYLSFTVIPA